MSAFKLPSISSMMCKEFLLFQKNELSTEQTLLFSLQTHTIFLQDRSSYFILTSNDSPKQITWKPCRVISSDANINELLFALNKYEIAIILGQSNTLLGFINSKILANSLIDSYKYLLANFETVIKILDVSVTVIDRTGRVLVWTDGAEKIFSVKKEDILGKDITNFFDIDMLEIMKSLKEGRSIYRHQHQPRSDLYVLINSNPVYLNNQIVGAAVSETDITSQVRLNQELFNVSSKIHHLEEEVAKLSPSKDPFHSIKGSTPAIKQTIELVKKISTTEATVLILGESGVGKEIFAKAIHELRESSKAPFVPIN